MRAYFTYAKIYNSDKLEIIMTKNCRGKPRQYAICHNAEDAQVICVALNATYNNEESCNT